MPRPPQFARLSRLEARLTEAVKVAYQEALQRDQRAQPVALRLAAVHARVRAAGRTGKKADKAFFDREWGATE